MEETKDGEVAADDSEGVSSDAPGNSLAETSTSYEAPESGAVKPDCGGCSLYRDVVCSVWWHPRDAFRPLTKMQMPTPAASWSLRFAATVQRRLVALHFEVRHKRGLERLKRMPALKRARHVQIREQYMRCSLPLVRRCGGRRCATVVSRCGGVGRRCAIVAWRCGGGGQRFATVV
ncbi:hypothetical protein M885DRAFT_562240 [Pelagophyceae sp. CCMP2097]|nr:hypothetical protein M885DRAFT_562240 [Pelagophyceae sp. CCMP2097]